MSGYAFSCVTLPGDQPSLTDSAALCNNLPNKSYSFHCRTQQMCMKKKPVAVEKRASPGGVIPQNLCVEWTSNF